MKTVPERYPEYNFEPTSYYRNIVSRFKKRFDYVQTIDTSTQQDGTRNAFFILWKDEKFGVLMYDHSCMRTIATVALPAKYDYKIEFVHKTSRSFTAIVKQNGKYGLYLWKYGFFSNSVYSVPVKYDELTYEKEKRRYRAIQNGEETYLDETGRLLP